MNHCPLCDCFWTKNASEFDGPGAIVYEVVCMFCGGPCPGCGTTDNREVDA